ncbi:MAG: pirin family protein [Crocinitomicaceae bacterium]
MQKHVRYILPSMEVDMGGFPVKQALPTNNVEQVDPFLLLHHARVKPFSDRPAKTQGVGPHPHRGFSPVTFVIEGEVNHQDSRGNNQVAKAGEVQWIHAGAGIIHSERPTQDLIDANGTQEIIQLWINTPAARKMIAPEYIHVSEVEIPRVIQSEEADVKLISGAYAGKSGAFRGQSELLILWGNLKKGATHSFDIPKKFNASVYSIKGNLRIEGMGLVDAESLVVFEEEGDTVTLHANTDTQFLLLSGLPIDEPLAQYGPFVMNSQTQIMEAMRDYQMGKMGFLVED